MRFVWTKKRETQTYWAFPFRIVDLLYLSSLDDAMEFRIHNLFPLDRQIRIHILQIPNLLKKFEVMS